MNASESKPKFGKGLSWLFRVQVAGGAFFLLVAAGVLIAFLLSKSATNKYQSSATVAVSSATNMDNFKNVSFVARCVTTHNLANLPSFESLIKSEVAASITSNISIDSQAGKQNTYTINYESTNAQDAQTVLVDLIRDFPAYSKSMPTEFVVVSRPAQGEQISASNGLRLLIGGGCGALLALLLAPLIFRVLG